MRLGLALDLGRQDLPLARLIERYAEMLRSVADQPFHSVWLGEAYGDQSGSGHISSPLLGLAALASATPAKLGTGVTLLPAWHPRRLAYDAAALDAITGGRLILGIGVGRQGLWDRFGIDAASVGAYVDDTLGEMQRLWAEGDPEPLTPGGPPLWIGGKAKAAFRRAVEFGEAYFAGSSTPLGEMQSLIDAYRDRLGSRPGNVALNRVAVVADSRDEARAIVETHLGPWHAGYRKRGLVGGDLGDAAGDLMILGDEDDLAEALRAYADLGVDQVNLRIAPSGLPWDLARSTLDRVCDSGLVAEGAGGEAS